MISMTLGPSQEKSKNSMKLVFVLYFVFGMWVKYIDASNKSKDVMDNVRHHLPWKAQENPKICLN